MTRGRERNVAHLVAEDVDDARRHWAAVFGRDRADLGPAHAAQCAVDDIEQYGLRSMRRYVRTVREPAGGTRHSQGPRPMPPELQRPTRTDAPGLGL